MYVIDLCIPAQLPYPRALADIIIHSIQAGLYSIVYRIVGNFRGVECLQNLMAYLYNFVGLIFAVRRSSANIGLLENFLLYSPVATESDAYCMIDYGIYGHIPYSRNFHGSIFMDG